MVRTAVLTIAFALASVSAWAQTAPAAKAKKAPVAAALAPADQAQLDAAGQAHLGAYQCEFNQTLDVSANDKAPGYVDVKHQKRVYTMKPVLSPTGALRLEDVKGQTLLLQIANKSMLMDVKAGKRLVDACMHEKQRQFIAAAPK